MARRGMQYRKALTLPLLLAIAAVATAVAAQDAPPLSTPAIRGALDVSPPSQSPEPPANYSDPESEPEPLGIGNARRLQFCVRGYYCPQRTTASRIACPAGQWGRRLPGHNASCVG